jgi:hypothetical protein
MSIDADIHADAFDLLCHKLLGEGIHRKVFSCRLNDDWVCKVEEATTWRSFANVMEARFWQDNQHYEAVAKWLAPIHFCSPDFHIIIQSRVEPIRKSDELPDTLPQFLTDIKRENFGWLNGKLVCVDYSMWIDKPPTRLVKREWI